MNYPEQIGPVKGKVVDEHVAETLARDTGAPIELAARIYEEELRNLARGARITQFVSVLASRRARTKLQHLTTHH